MPYKDKQQQTQYQNHWLKKRRLQWLQDNGPCAMCGSWDRLQVDHKDFADKLSHRIWSWSEKRRAAELKKCQVLCWSCHKAKSSIDLSAQKRGEGNSQARLTTEQVQRIRGSTEDAVVLADRYGVSRSTIWDIRSRRTWTHVD